MTIKITETLINGVYELQSTAFHDNRGKFLNVFRNAEQEYKTVWGNKKIQQINISETSSVGSIRGLHLQDYPYSEYKLIRCIVGEVFDVAVDLRKDSKTFGKWISIKLNDKIDNAILIPEGCAHGFQVLKPNTKLLYVHSGHWNKESEIGYRWNDPLINIDWPLPLTEISTRDQNLPFLKL